MSKSKGGLTRRKLLAGAVGTAAIGGLAWAKPSDNGAPHDDYFKGMAQAVKQAGLGKPTLVIDHQRLMANLATLRQHMGDRFGWRVVAKSLPCLDLLQAVTREAETDKLMVFHQPFLNHVARRMPHADVLLGKPQPVAAAARFYDLHQPGDFAPERQVQWLIDTLPRLQQYEAMAKARGLSLAVSLEIDVGLHRGGFNQPSQFHMALQAIKDSPHLRLAGLMGYEAHLAKIPGILGGPEEAYRKSTEQYLGFLEQARKVFGDDLPQNLTLNTGGSTTYQLYKPDHPATELSTGSALAQPSDFDLFSLVDHVPAAFIATPVLKTSSGTRISSIEFLSQPMGWWDPNTRQSNFIYGGNWLADPVSPAGLQMNTLFGHSSNQELYNSSPAAALKVDDTVFFRPRQSEAVFLQFGDIAVYRDGRIDTYWPVFG